MLKLDIDSQPDLQPSGLADVQERMFLKLRFATDSPLEGDGFELPVPGALGEAERARRGKITDPLFSFVSLAYGYPATSCVGINPKNLNRPPKR